MLELRPTCENCNKPLPPDALEARICTFECTFCVACVEGVLGNVCSNCGGGFCPRPVRPATNWCGDNWTGKYPSSTKVRHRPAIAPSTPRRTPGSPRSSGTCRRRSGRGREPHRLAPAPASGKSQTDTWTSNLATHLLSMAQDTIFTEFDSVSSLLLGLMLSPSHSMAVGRQLRTTRQERRDRPFPE